VDAGALAEEGREFVGHNIKAVIARSKEDARRRRRPGIRGAARLRDELKRLQSTALAIADDPFARQSDVARAGLDAEITYSTDDSPSKPIPSKGGKGKRLSRPGRPKTFGSRAR
jgi:excinuclease ABC subunit B